MVSCYSATAHPLLLFLFCSVAVCAHPYFTLFIFRSFALRLIMSLFISVDTKSSHWRRMQISGYFAALLSADKFLLDAGWRYVLERFFYYKLFTFTQSFVGNGGKEDLELCQQLQQLRNHIVIFSLSIELVLIRWKKPHEICWNYQGKHPNDFRTQMKASARFFGNLRLVCDVQQINKLKWILRLVSLFYHVSLSWWILQIEEQFISYSHHHLHSP